MAKGRQRFDFHPEAIIETQEAVEWYALRSPDAAFNFKQELRRAEQSVTQQPASWATYLHGTRCFLLERFPFGLVYIKPRDRIVGIAVAHLKRRPGYWRKRLSD
jgi:ParE toxin of type II toxin-antitoxin system, parDE